MWDLSARRQFGSFLVFQLLHMVGQSRALMHNFGEERKPVNAIVRSQCAGDLRPCTLPSKLFSLIGIVYQLE